MERRAPRTGLPFLRRVAAHRDGHTIIPRLDEAIADLADGSALSLGLALVPIADDGELNEEIARLEKEQYR